MESKFKRLLNKGCKFITRGHDFVEIGGIKWATCNVGADKPTDVGLYFAWGETQGYTAKEIYEHKHSFSSEFYKFSLGGLIEDVKYNVFDGKETLDKVDDPVFINWGGSWRLPTAEEFEKLSKSSVSRFVENYEGSKVNGLLVVDKECHERKIFLPAVGYGNNFMCAGHNEFGLYWGNSLCGYSSFCGNCLRFHPEGIDWIDCYKRSFGFSVRGILDI